MSASLELDLPADVFLRTPTIWDRLRGVFWEPDLSTEEQVLRRDLLSVTEGVCAALREVRICDAVYLVVAGRSAFHDTLGIPNDLGALLEAARSELREPCDELRAVFMHQDEGLEILVEATLQRRFRKHGAAAVASLCGRLSAMRVQPGETQDQCHDRVTSILRHPSILEGFRDPFAELVGRLQQALGRLFPDGAVRATEVTTFLQRPSRKAVEELSQLSLADPHVGLRQKPGCYHQSGNPFYDPWSCYCYDPGTTYVDLVALEDLAGGRWAPSGEHPLSVVDEHGAVLCDAAAVANHAALFEGIGAAAAHSYAVPDAWTPADYPGDGGAVQCEGSGGDGGLLSTFGDLFSSGSDGGDSGGGGD